MPVFEDCSTGNPSRAGTAPASLFLVTLLALGFVLSGRLESTLALPETAAWTNLHRFLTWMLVFDTGSASIVNLPYILLALALFFPAARGLERALGSSRLLALFLSCTFTAGLAAVLLQGTHSLRPVATAEMMPGPVGVIVYAALLDPRRRTRSFFFLPTSHLAAAALSVGAMGIFWVAVYGTPAAWIAPGFAILNAWTLWWLRLPLRRIRSALATRREKARKTREALLRYEVDAILDKIHTSGLESLNRKEVRVLKKASRRFAETRNRCGD